MNLGVFLVKLPKFKPSAVEYCYRIMIQISLLTCFIAGTVLKFA